MSERKEHFELVKGASDNGNHGIAYQTSLKTEVLDLETKLDFRSDLRAILAIEELEAELSKPRQDIDEAAEASQKQGNRCVGLLAVDNGIANGIIEEGTVEEIAKPVPASEA
jgi:hypothetical protein